MDKNKIIKLTNGISLISIILLIYWVFAFITIQVFGLKIFRENISEIFYFSIFGILSLLAGAVIVNVMFNLTKISETMSGEYDNSRTIKNSVKKIYISLFAISFPVILLLLYLGDHQSTIAKEKHLVKSAKFIIDNNKQMLDEFAEFKIDSLHLSVVSGNLAILSRESESFPMINVLYSHKLKGKEVYVKIGQHFYWSNDFGIKDYIFPCSVEEKKYLKEVFTNSKTDHHFSASDGRYELYYPVTTEKGTFVLYCTDYQRYGKIGS
ncbi:MAG: hypothetical protein ACEPO8_09575 [Rhodothermaceae bacterium]